MSMEDEWSNRTWGHTPFLCMDFETTGYRKEDRICEVSFILAMADPDAKGEGYRGIRILKEFNSVVDPGIVIPEEATSIHGITNAMVDDAPSFADLEPEIMEFLEDDNPWVSHNLAYDLRMLKREIKPDKWPKGIPTLCTLSYARKKHPATRLRGHHKLIDLAGYFYVDFDLEKQHGARYDALVLAQIVPKMMGFDRPVSDGITKMSEEWL